MAICNLSIFSVLVGPGPGFGSTLSTQESSNITTETMIKTFREPDNLGLFIYLECPFIFSRSVLVFFYISIFTLFQVAVITIVKATRSCALRMWQSHAITFLGVMISQLLIWLRQSSKKSCRGISSGSLHSCNTAFRDPLIYIICHSRFGNQWRSTFSRSAV